METNSNTKSSPVNASSPKKPAQSLATMKPKIPKRNTNKYALISSANNEDTESYLDSFPAGYRFCPIDEELVVCYLKKRLSNEPLPPNRIHEVNIYQHNPYDLAGMYKGYGEKEIYFFTPRDKKYRNGSRPNRAAGNGYWKATGADKQIKFKGEVVGYKKALVFYEGKPPRGEKTNWIMHEYRVIFSAPIKRGPNDMRLDDSVLCRIYKKVNRGLKSIYKKEDEHSEHSVVIEETDDPMSLDGVNGSTSGYANTANSYAAGYMHNIFQQNAVPQVPLSLDTLDNLFNTGDQLDADMFNIEYNCSDQFWNTLPPENFSFDPRDLTNRFEDSLNLKNNPSPHDKLPK